MTDWKETTLEEIAAPIKGAIAIGPFGSRMKSDCYVDSGVAVIRGTNISGTQRLTGNFVYITKDKAKELGSANLVPGDLVFPHRGSIGQVALVPDNPTMAYVISSSLMKLTCDPQKADPIYLFYYFRTYEGRHEILKYASTVGTPGIGQPLTSLKSMKIPLPTLKAQKRIAGILGALDDKIELNRRTNETLEAMGRAIFQSWFVDFDPVLDNAIAAGNAIPAELKEKAALRKQQKNKHPLPEDIKKLFPDSFEDSPLGPIPKGWKVTPIADEVSVVGGGTPSTKKAEYWGGGTIHFTTPKDLNNITSPVLLDTERKITDLGLSRVSSGLLPEGTVLLSSRAPIGYLAIAEIPVAVNQGFIAMVCEQQLPNLYVLYWAMQNMETIKSRANGTTFMEVSKKNFRPIEIIVPGEAVLDAFMHKALPLYRNTVINLKENETLTQLRDTLLPKLLTGEIEV